MISLVDSLPQIPAGSCPELSMATPMSGSNAVAVEQHLYVIATPFHAGARSPLASLPDPSSCESLHDCIIAKHLDSAVLQCSAS